MGVRPLNLYLKLLLKAGCADISVSAEWAAGMLSASIAFPQNDNPFVTVSHEHSPRARAARNAGVDHKEGSP